MINSSSHLTYLINTSSYRTYLCNRSLCVMISPPNPICSMNSSRNMTFGSNLICVMNSPSCGCLSAPGMARRAATARMADRFSSSCFSYSCFTLFAFTCPGNHRSHVSKHSFPSKIFLFCSIFKSTVPVLTRHHTGINRTG